MKEMRCTGTQSRQCNIAHDVISYFQEIAELIRIDEKRWVQSRVSWGNPSDSGMNDEMRAVMDDLER